MEAILTALRTAPALQERLKNKKKSPYHPEAIHHIIKSISPLTIEEIRSTLAEGGQTARSDMMNIIRERHTPPKPEPVAVPEPEPVAVPEPEPEPVAVPEPEPVPYRRPTIDAAAALAWSLNVSDEEYDAIQNGLPWPPVTSTEIVPYVKAPVKTKTPKTKAPKEPKTKTPKTKEPKTIPHSGGGYSAHQKHSLNAQHYITEEWARQWLVGAVPDTTNLYDVGGRYLKALWQLAKKGIWRVPEVGEKMNTGSLGSIPAIIGYLLAYRSANTPKADDMYAEPGSD